MEANQIKETIKPFSWIEYEREDGTMSYSVTLYADMDYKFELFESRKEDGFLGNGYDWASLADVFITERMPDVAGIVYPDPEADMFCYYSSDRNALEKFALGFKSACEDDALIRDLFSRAELD